MNCNLRCEYCYIGQDPVAYPQGFQPKGLSIDEIKLVISKISKSSHALSLYGGEPFLRKDLLEILQFAKSLDFGSLEVVTNGTLLVKNIKSVELLDVINISYDPTRQRQYSEQMNKMLEDALWIRKKLKKSIMFFITLCEEDQFSDLTDLLNFMQNHKFCAFFQPVRTKSMIHDLKWFNEIMKSIKDEYPKIFYFNQIKNYVPLDYNRCLPQLSLSVTYEGNLVYPCQMFRTRIAGSLLESDVAELWKKGKEKYGTFPNKECENCGYLCMWDIGNNFRYPWKVNFFNY